MFRHLTAVLSAACVAALGLSGCSSQTESPASSASSTEATTSTAVAAPAPAPLPPPEALTDVLYKLADPAVPGANKLGLVEGATADNAATLDKFAKALQDNGFTPLTFAATDIAWSDKDPGNVVATVNVTTANSGSGPGFSFPMEFTPTPDGWQLSRSTADMLLSFGNAPTGTTPTPTG
jgi:hypothetical protein